MSLIAVGGDVTLDMPWFGAPPLAGTLFQIDLNFYLSTYASRLNDTLVRVILRPAFDGEALPTGIIHQISTDPHALGTVSPRSDMQDALTLAMRSLTNPEVGVVYDPQPTCGDDEPHDPIAESLTPEHIAAIRAEVGNSSESYGDFLDPTDTEHFARHLEEPDRLVMLGLASDIEDVLGDFEHESDIPINITICPGDTERRSWGVRFQGRQIGRLDLSIGEDTPQISRRPERPPEGERSLEL